MKGTETDTIKTATAAVSVRDIPATTVPVTIIDDIHHDLVNAEANGIASPGITMMMMVIGISAHVTRPTRETIGIMRTSVDTGTRVRTKLNLRRPRRSCRKSRVA